jgi:stage II sporulation protein D (peptidoglycan lytic transglycosylase)
MRNSARGLTHPIPCHSLHSIIHVACILAILTIMPSTPTSAGALHIRVLLFQRLPSFTLSVPPDYSIVTQPTGLLPANADGWRTLHVQATPKNFHISGLDVEGEELRLVPRTKTSLIYAGSKLYRGGLEVKWRAGGLIVVNTLDLEEYLYGVVPKEAPTQWQMAALRAQAVVARTYALYKRTREANRDYDVASQYIRDQHYEGYGAEHPRTTQAVDDTRGLVLTCHGDLIPTYYHAESAGYTENSEDVWSSAHPCLRAVKTQMHPASPYLQWSASVPLQDIRSALAKRGYAVGPIRRLEPIRHSPTGRIMLLKIGHKLGETVVRGTDFRLALGPEVIRSTRFTVHVREGRAFFAGQGWGHGVGLCQWCSQGMAELGYDHEAILIHYYQGAKLMHYR